MSTTILPPESRLLLLAAGGAVPSESIVAHARAVRSWPALLHLAERERACGALWRLLAPHERHGVDGDGLAALRRIALVEGFRAQRQRARLREALRTLGQAGVPVMLLKGAALATTAYPSFEARAMSDLDLLVRPADAARAFAALVDAGWRYDRELFPEGMYQGHQHLPPLTDAPRNGVVLEPHVGLVAEENPFALDVDAVWQAGRPVEVDGARALVPSPAHLALHAALHLAWSHALMSGGWRTLRDLHALTAGGHLAWGELAEAAERARATTCVHWCLALGRATGVLDVPDAVVRRLRPRGLAPGVPALLMRHFLLQLFAPAAPCPSARLRRTLWSLAIRSSGSADAGRPWSRNERFARFGAPAEVEAASKRAAAWGTYLRGALLGRAAG